MQANATAQPLNDGVADAVTMISMLHQVADWHAALREGASGDAPRRTAGGDAVPLCWAAPCPEVHQMKAVGG